MFAEIDNTEKDDIAALKNFLLDIECLNELSEWTSKFNLFDILKISRAEIRHSNILSWLLNPNENHGLDDSVLRGFIQFTVEEIENTTTEKLDIFKTLLMNCHDFSIYREWHNIDVLAVSNDEKFVLCIENKIGTGEHDDQLNRYRKIVEEHYPDYEKMYIYLTPNKDDDELSDPDNWCSMGYDNVLDIIENACKKTVLRAEADLLINNYIETIRNFVLRDNTELEQACQKIYKKHRKALDLIFDSRPDMLSELNEIFHKWANEKCQQGDIIYTPDNSNKTYTRFTTKTMSEILPNAENPTSGWGTHNYYFYEIVNNRKNFLVQLAISAKEMPEELRKICNQLFELLNKKPKENWQWHALFKTKFTKIDENEELSEEKIFKQLDKYFEEVKKFESQLVEKLKQDLPQ